MILKDANIKYRKYCWQLNLLINEVNIMNKNILLIIIVLFSISCETEQNQLPKSIDYVSSFSTEPRPQAITVDKESGFIYVASYKPYISDYNTKIQKFNRGGKLLKTVVDFTIFDKGNFLRYEPVDITIDNNRNLYVLVRPLIKNPDNTWSTSTGFCILQFDIDDNFHKEFDLLQIDGRGFPSAIAYSDECVFVANGPTIKKISLDNDQVSDISIQTNDENVDSLIFLHVSDMAINSDGIIYLTGQAVSPGDDVSGCHITKFNPHTGQLITSYSKGRTGIMAAWLNNPGLSISSGGNIYLATYYGMGLEIFTGNGEFIMQTDIRTANGVETRPIDLALDNGHIYIVDNLNNLLFVYKEQY